jgi:CTP synthase
VPPQLDEWRDLVARMRRVSEPVRIAIVGKYVELHDAYMSVKEALSHAAAAEDHKLEIEWIYSGDLEKDKGWDILETVHGVVVPGGFGERGVEGKVRAAEYARTRRIPYLGLCLGMQVMSIEFARNVLGLEEANSTEFDSATEHPVIDLMPDQHNVTNLGGTMRLGVYPCALTPGTKAAAAYQATTIDERHRHRFEFKNRYRESFEAAGACFSGQSPDGRLVEIMELLDHPFMVGSQFHPEFLSRPNRPHPLFQAFLNAAVQYKNSTLEK